MSQPIEIKLKKGATRRLRNGHLWVFSNELENIPDVPSGEVVRVRDHDGRSFGLALYNPHSLISARLLLTEHEFDSELINTRIKKALSHRERLNPGEPYYRLVFAEADLLPGLIIDRFNDVFSVQTHSAGMDRRLDDVVAVLKEIFPGIRGIVEKNKSPVRGLEGLPEREGVLLGEVPERVQIRENGVLAVASPAAGQKTGYFFDQRENRRIIRDLAGGFRVLDVFSGHGGFSLHAATGNAGSVTAIDGSEYALDCLREAAVLSSFDNIETIKGDAFEILAGMSRDVADLIILDPPAFAKSKKNVPAAKKAYLELNRHGFRLLPPGGYLATASCSHHVYEDTFREIVTEAAKMEGRRIRLIHRGGQAADHPVLAGMQESSYLKFFVYQVVAE